MSDNGKRELNQYVKMGITIFATAAACILFFFAIFRIGDILDWVEKLIKAAEPIIIGLGLAYLLMPVKNFVEKPLLKWLPKLGLKEEKCKSVARALSIAASIVFLIVIIALLIAILVPALTNSIVVLVDATPKYLTSFLAWINSLGVGEDSIAIVLGEYISTVITSIQEWAKYELLPLIQQYIGEITSGVYSVLKTLLNFIIGIIVMVYVMSIHETLKGQSKKIIYAVFPAKKANHIIDVFRKSNEVFGGFIIGKIIDSAIIGVICYIGCLVLRMPSALLVSVIIGVTNIIPFFGPFIGAIPSILIVLIQSPMHGLYLAIFILVLQQIDGNIIGPKILGDTTGLSSFWVLFAIMIAGSLFGIVGMIVGVPLFAVIYYLCQQAVKYRMARKGLSNNTEDYIDVVAIDANSKTMIYAKEEEKTESDEK